MIRWASPKKVVDPKGRRLIGRTIEGGEPVFAPPGHASISGANGSGKSTCVAVPAILSMISASPAKGLMALDVKDGEQAAQLASMLADMGLKVGVIDDLRVRAELERFRIEINPLGAILSAYQRDPRDVIFTLEHLLLALIPEPENDERNRYFRAWPRKLIEFVILALLKRNLDLVTPGGVAAILADGDMLATFAQIEAEEGEPMLRALAKSILDMRGHEHWGQHLEAAQRALRLFSPGTRLAEIGRSGPVSEDVAPTPTVTHEQLISEAWVIFLVGPQRFMTALGPYFALHILSFCDALYQSVGPLRMVADEWTNCPVKPLVSALTTLRAYGGEITMISQSPSEVIRKFGEQEAQTIEDNSITKQWLGFSSFKVAEQISQAMGEEHAVAEALSGDIHGLKTQTNLSLIKQRRKSAAELMAMPRNRMLVHIKGLGFFELETIPQNEIAPFCDLLADNPLEGGRLPPDPKLTLTIPKGG